MKLCDITRMIDPVILERGRNYLLDGRIVSFEKITETVYAAKVAGSELYEVKVELDGVGGILSSECDCPYDIGPICKHQAAVLLKLRDEMFSGMDAKAGISSRPNHNLKKLLEAESKESLISLLLSLAEDSELVEQRIRLHVAVLDKDEELAEYRRLIQSYIRAYVDVDGYVSYRDVDRAVEGAELVSKKAVEAANLSDWFRALRIYLCILEEMLNFLQIADDSDGTISSLIEESLECIREIALEGDCLPSADREEMFRMLLKELESPLLDGWTDWQLALLESASCLAVTEDLRKEWEQHVSRISSRQETGSWSGDYFSERIAMLHYRLIQKFEGDERTREFLTKHLRFPSFRKMAIQEALDHGRFDEAIRLAEEGEKLDKVRGLHGLVTQWKHFRYEAYRRSGQIEMQRRLGEELLLDGDFTYYEQLKATYPVTEWPSVYRRLLKKLEKVSWLSNIYTRILVQEQETAKLLEYVRKYPSKIEDFYPYLIEQYSSEVKELFQTHIEETAKQAGTRKDYRNICRIIRMLRQAGGEAEAYQTVQMLLAKYPRKPAFREELMKLKFR